MDLENISPSIGIIKISLDMDLFYLEGNIFKNRFLFIFVVIWYLSELNSMPK